MSAGSEFNATGLEKLKTLSLNLVRIDAVRRTSARSTLPNEAVDAMA